MRRDPLWPFTAVVSLQSGNLQPQPHTRARQVVFDCAYARSGTVLLVSVPDLRNSAAHASRRPAAQTPKRKTVKYC